MRLDIDPGMSWGAHQLPTKDSEMQGVIARPAESCFDKGGFILLSGCFKKECPCAIRIA
jgi:hypothetical protein